jgi:DNA-binding SARP family transcriptional activator
MEFRILGPLEVWARGAPLELRQRRHRALLAALLLRAGEIVSVDQLLDDLWGERAPPTAKGSLQNAVSALRKLLGAEMLGTQAPGYLLDVARERVDLFRFERLLAEARSAPTEAERAEKLRLALALWRGPPLADLAFQPFALLEVPRLEDLHLAAREELIEARLALGEHAELLPELEALAVEYPFDERLRGQLMLALYRAGRQAAALEAYRAARSFLVEELGLEPSAPLRELEQAILRHDPALRPSPGTRRPNFVPMRKTASVLVAQRVDSDALHDQLDPEALSGLFDREFAAIQRVVERHGGTIELFLGDAVMAVFGVPKAHEDDAFRALRAALELRGDSLGLGDELKLRIGVDSGEVFVSDTATGLTGAVLNSAKRLAEAASADEILLGAASLRVVRRSATTEPLEPLAAREGRPLGAWRLLGLIDGAPAIPRRLEAPLVGRGEELARLRQAFESARDQSQCELVVLAGEPGIGKTRLAREFVAEVGPKAQVLIGRCASYGEGATWLPLAEILREAGAETPEVLLVVLSAEPDGQLVTSRVAGAIGASEEPAPLEETNWAIRRLFEVLARKLPLLLVFEDVHWAEPALVDLIDYLGGRATGQILLLCLARPELLETRTEWAERAITLGALPDADVHALVDALPTHMDSDARARVVEVAEGNPLFAEQLVAHAEEEGSETLDLAPPSIEALLASRLDLLTAEERAVLQRAAVIGRRFSRAAVIELSAGGATSAEAQLQALSDKGFIRIGASDESLSFHHGLVRNVAYAGIPKSLRADLHERAADWLDRHSTNPDELVGYHLEQAYFYRFELGPLDEPALELARRAAERFASSVDRAVAGEDMRAAAALSARAAHLLPEHDPLRIRLLAIQGEALDWVAEGVPATAVLDAAIDGARAVGDHRLEWGARIERSFAWRLTDPQAWAGRARHEAERAIEACTSLGHDAGLVKAWRLLAILERDRGHYRAAEQALERALEYARRLQDKRMERAVLGVLAQIAVFGPTPVEDAIRLVEDHLKLAKTRGYFQWQAECNERLAVLWAMRRQFVKARELLAEGRALRENVGVPGGLVSTALVETLAGDPAAAERAYRPALRLFEEQGNRGFVATIAAELAHVLHVQGRDDEVLELAEQSEKEAGPDDVQAQTLWRRARAKVVADRGALDEAERLAREALELASATDDVLLHGDARVDLAEVVRSGGRVEDAARALEDALSLYERKGNLASGGRARKLLEEIKNSVPSGP